MQQLKPKLLRTDPPENGDRVLMWEEKDKYWQSVKYYDGYSYDSNQYWLPDLAPPSMLLEGGPEWLVERHLQAPGWVHLGLAND